jgi:hypothetical protein
LKPETKVVRVSSSVPLTAVPIRTGHEGRLCGQAHDYVQRSTLGQTIAFRNPGIARNTTWSR